MPLPSLASGEKPLAPAAVKPPSAAPAAPVMVKVAAPWYTQGTVLIESVVNERWLLEAGPDRRVGKIRGQEGGWTGHNCKPVVSADDNYYDRAMWKIVPTDSDGVVLIESFATERYLLEAGPDGKVGSIRGREGGWIGQNNKPVVSADNNYYDRALWKLVPSGSPNEFFIVSVVNERYLFETGPDRRVGNVRGLEEGWIGQNSKPVVSADDNYYDRARWKLLPGDHTPAPEKSLVPVPISQAPDPPNAVGPTGSTSGFVGDVTSGMRLSLRDSLSLHRLICSFSGSVCACPCACPFPCPCPCPCPCQGLCVRRSAMIAIDKKVEEEELRRESGQQRMTV